MKALRFNFYRNIGGRLMMWFLILSLVPVIAVGFINYYVTKGQLTRSTDAYLLELTRTTAESVDDWVQGRTEKLRGYAENPVLLSGNREQIQAFCKMVAGNTQDVEMIFFADLSGNAITSTGQQVNVADGDYFKAVTGGKEVAVSSLLISKATGNKVVVIAVPVKGPAGLVGILAGNFEPKTLIGKIENIKYGQTGYAYMIDSTGLVIVHPDESKVMRLNLTRTDSESLNRVSEKMLKGGAGVEKYTFEGIEKLAAFSPVKSAGWVVALTAPTREVYAGVNAIARITVLIILVVAVIAILLSLFVSRQITRPIVKLTEQAEQLATGDLRLEVATGFYGELGVLDKALKTMLANTTGVLRSVNDAISSLEGSIKEISAAADDTARASEQVAQTISQVASGAQNTAQYISNISSKTEETVNRTGHGEKIMQELASRIRALAEKAKAIGEAMARLTEDAGQITRITDVITGIAEQTNLLALNAAIEAARAGEAGRGFAVVAEEVRKLAENSRKQAGEITRLIAHVTGDVKMSATMTQETVSLVEEEARIGEEALAEFAEIARGSREVAEFLNNIAATSEENAASAEEIAASAQEMSSATQNISASARNLTALMERLKEQARRFKL